MIVGEKCIITEIMISLSNLKGLITMKKIIALVLALVMCLSLCACGGSKKSSNKYNYVTNSNGSRTWYETGNSHIVRID